MKRLFVLVFIALAMICTTAFAGQSNAPPGTTLALGTEVIQSTVPGMQNNIAAQPDYIATVRQSDKPDYIATGQFDPGLAMTASNCVTGAFYGDLTAMHVSDTDVGSYATAALDVGATAIASARDSPNFWGSSQV